MVEKTVPLKTLFEEASKIHKQRRCTKKGKLVREKETGFKNTRKVYCQACKNKFTYRYKYFDEKENKHRVLTSINFKELREKVKKEKKEWEMTNYYEARKTAKEVGLPLKDLM